MVEEDESSDSEDESDDEDDESVVLNVENRKGGEGSSGSVSASQSDKESGESTLEEGDRNVSLEKGHVSGSSNFNNDSAEQECTVVGEISGPMLPISSEPESTVHSVDCFPNSIIVNNEKISVQTTMDSSSEKNITDNETSHVVETTLVSPGSIQTVSTHIIIESKEALNFNDFCSPSELEVSSSH